MARKRLRPQVRTRLVAGRCSLCPEARPETLETHRIHPGAEGGKYTPGNMVSLCSNCHAMVTAGRIEIYAIRASTAHPLGVLHWKDENGEEHFSPLPAFGSGPETGP